MRAVLAVWIAVILLAAPISKSEELPGSCAIIATQAYAKVDGAYWRGLISIIYVDSDNFPNAVGHMICVWQPFEGSHVLVYNLNGVGTIELKTSSHNIVDITKLLAGAGRFIILSSRFVE